jgi:zinc protease
MRIFSLTLDIIEKIRSTFSAIICLSALLAILSFSSASLADEKLGDKVYETVLANGLKVILFENHKAPVVTVQMWYRVGSRNEAWGKTGLSHLLEHMMFKGSKRFTAEQFIRIIEENGGKNNAFTSRDYTAYFVNIIADRVAIPLELEADRMRNAIFDEKEFLTEKKVVIEERRLRTEDNPQSFLYENVFATAYQVHPYHWPIIGWMEDLERLTLADAREYYNQYYSPANAFLIVAGDFSRQELLPKIEQAFGHLHATYAQYQGVSRDPTQKGERRVIIKREGLVPALMMGYHVPNLKNPDSYVLEVIEAILSSGKSSRFYEHLIREKQVALRADADYPLTSLDPSLFFISAEVLAGKDLLTLEKAIDDEIMRLQAEPVTPEELSKAKNQIEARFLYGQDSVFYQAMILAQHEIASTWKHVDDYLPAIRRVKADDVIRVARQYLIPENRTVGLFSPIPPQDNKPVLPKNLTKEQGHIR